MKYVVATADKLSGRTRFGSTSRFQVGVVFNLASSASLWDEDAYSSIDDVPAEDFRPGFKTTIKVGNKNQEFDSLHLASLVRPIVDINGESHLPEGSLATLAQEKYNDASLTTDADVLDAILNGKVVKVKVEKGTTITRLSRNGSQYRYMMPKWEIIS